MSDKRVFKSYYIGDPDKRHERGRDKHRMVHCLVWGLIYNKGGSFAKADEHSVGVGGGIIGKAKTIPKARQTLHDYAIQDLKRKRKEAEDLIARCDQALEILGDDPANLEQFTGVYDEKSPS